MAKRWTRRRKSAEHVGRLKNKASSITVTLKHKKLRFWRAIRMLLESPSKSPAVCARGRTAVQFVAVIGGWAFVVIWRRRRRRRPRAHDGKRNRRGKSLTECHTTCACTRWFKWDREHRGPFIRLSLAAVAAAAIAAPAKRGVHHNY